MSLSDGCEGTKDGKNSEDCLGIHGNSMLKKRFKTWSPVVYEEEATDDTPTVYDRIFILLFFQLR